jgi:glutathione synthase/RimK-type ligase-like ATP-grasp enzyme
MLHVLCRWRGEKWLSRVMPAPQRRLDLGLLFSKHKFTMAAAEAGIPVPKWSPATTWEEAVRAAEEFGYPMMLKKPVGFAGSGVRMASSRGFARGLRSIWLAAS